MRYQPSVILSECINNFARVISQTWGLQIWYT